MQHHIPTELQPLFEAWIAALTPVGERIHGAYLSGSLALAAWNPAASDIDAVVLTTGDWSSGEIAALRDVHAGLARTYPRAARLEVIYFPLAHLGRANDATPPYPAFRDGEFLATTHGDVNAVTWWLLKQYGIRLAGPEPNGLPIEVSWNDVLAAMRYNLDVYWKRRVAMPGGIRFLHDEWVEFGVTTACRILSTLEDDHIIPKDAALALWRDRLPERWRPLLAEAQRLRGGGPGSGALRSRLTRMREARAFIRYVQERCPAPADQESLGGSPSS